MHRVPEGVGVGDSLDFTVFLSIQYSKMNLIGCHHEKDHVKINIPAKFHSYMYRSCERGQNPIKRIPNNKQDRGYLASFSELSNIAYFVFGSHS